MTAITTTAITMTASTMTASTMTTTPVTTDAPLSHTVTDSPIGPLTLVARGGVLHGLYMGDLVAGEHRHAPDPAGLGDRDETGLQPALDQLEEYFAGVRREFDVEVDVDGTPFQRLVWDGLCRIPYGETRSYGQLAADIGRPGASRAVGLANGRNPVAIIVPCHRVIGANGTLTGYGGGLERKAALLALERSDLVGPAG
jgi:methylated-DNA-[protein]-cysteine S-methyltransferase